MKKFFLVLLFFVLVACVTSAQNIPDERALLNEIQQSPNSADLRTQLGKYYLNQMLYKKAIAQFETAVSLDPSDSRGRYYLGLVYELSGEYEKAVETYRDCLNWSDYALNFRLGVNETRLGKFNDALFHLKQVEGMRDSPGIHYALSFAQAGIGNYAEATKELQLAQKEDPRYETGKEFFPDSALLEQTLDNWKEKERKNKFLREAFAVGGIAAAIIALFATIRIRQQRKDAEEEF